MVADFQVGAVGGQSAFEGGGHPGRHVPAGGGGAVQDDVGLVFSDRSNQDLGVGHRREPGKPGVVGVVDGPAAELAEGLEFVLQAVADGGPDHPASQRVGQLDGFADQFPADVGDLPFVLLDEHHDVLLRCHPMIFSSISSCMSPAMPWSVLGTCLASPAVSTTFWTFLTLVGEPDSPQRSGSAPMDAMFHCRMVS